MIDIVSLYCELTNVSKAEQIQRLSKLKVKYLEQAIELEKMLRVDDTPLSSTSFLSQHLAPSHPTTYQAFIGLEVMGFTITNVLSDSGGMGFVFQGEQTISSPNNIQHEIHKAAIKILRPDKLNTQQQKAMFFNEASSLMMLDHPNVCSIYGVSEVLGQPCIVMDYIDGEPLDLWLQNNNTNKKQKLNLFIQLLTAMSYLHGLQMHHGDLKPQNIIVNEQGHLIVIDLGLTSNLRGDNEHCVQAFSRGWSAPEQVTGKVCTAQSDVYSLGTILAYLLSASPEKLNNILSIKNKELRVVINKAIATEPSNRYQNADELLEAVNLYLCGYPLPEYSTGVLYQFKKLLKRKPVTSLACVLMVYSVVSSCIILIT